MGDAPGGSYFGKEGCVFWFWFWFGVHAFNRNSVKVKVKVKVGTRLNRVRFVLGRKDALSVVRW